MKTICNLKGPEFLRHCNAIRHTAGDVLENTKVLELRKRLPDYTGKETPEEKKAKEAAQANKNISDMLDLLLDEKPEETYKLLRLFVITEDGEEEPDGMDLLMTGFEVLADKRVVDFLSSLIRLGQTSMVV